MRRILGARNATASEAFARPILAGSTVGTLGTQGYSRGAALGGPTLTFEPVASLPAQVPRRSRSELQPELRLMLAVLEDAVGVCGRRLMSHTDHTRADARDWITSDDAAWPYSFVNICEALGYDAGRIRRTVLGEGFAFRSQRDRGTGPSRTQVCWFGGVAA